MTGRESMEEVDRAEYILPLSKVSRGDSGRVGRKAATLGELIASGFVVPDGYVLTTSAFRRFLQENEPATPSSSSTHIPEDVSAALSTVYEALGRGLLAVRSSSTSEDLPNASFAGQYESVLGVKGKPELAEAVKRCWLSAYGFRAAEYNRTHAGSGGTEMAVVVQKLVRADAAGVAFTINPVTGTKEVVVNAIRGLGDRLVSGSATPDEWVVRDRATRVSRVEDAITEEQVLEVAQLARKVESHFDAPQDIEWAISGGRLFLLQARPITARAAARPPTKVTPVPIPIAAPEGYWTLEREHFPRPMSPMFASYGFDMTNRWLREMPKDLGLPFEGIEFRLIGGWTYGRLVPPGGKDRRPPPAWLLRLLVRILPSVRSQVNKMADVVRNDVFGSYIRRWNTEWKPDVVKRGNELLTIDLTSLTDNELDAYVSDMLEYVNRAKELHFRYLAVTLFNVGDFGAQGQEHMKWDPLKVFGLLAGLSEKSSEPGRRLSDLARTVRGNPPLAAAIENAIETGKVEGALAMDSSFAEQFSSYLKDFGIAALGYEVNDPTLAEMPVELLRLVKAQMERGYDPSEVTSKLEHRRTAAEAEISEANLSEETKSQLKQSLVKARTAYALHDEETFYTQNLPDGMTRRALLEVGTRLAAKGAIMNRDDIFMLTMDEARTALRKGGDLKKVAEKRLGEQLWALANPGPPSYGTPAPPPPMDVFPGKARRFMRSLMWTLGGISLGKAAEGGQLRGTPASSGKYEGVVRIIHDETEFEKLRPGDILVCPTTAPSWSVVFSIIGALVTEAGGVLSHPAIVAREYGIPAVLSLQGATQTLRDGQRLSVDGDSGTVTPVS